MNLFLIILFSLTQNTSIYQFQAESIDGNLIDFSQYRGKKLMIVNTASKCGYTPQYEELQQLHEQYGDQLVILGFPSDNFAGQELGTNDEIAAFCKLNYGVTFQMFSKIDVKGKQKHPIYQWLTNKELNGINSKAPSWNFCKYLIDEQGKIVKFLPSRVTPMDQEILDFVLID